MAFVCPDCSKSSLEVFNFIELPYDSRSDEIRVQTLECTACPFIGAGIYEESRRGSFEHDSWEHSCFRMELNHFHALKNMIKKCPDPSNYDCSCFSHKGLGVTNDLGRWQGLANLGEYFALKRPD